MASEKDRLYVAIYGRGGGVQPRMPGGEDKYHWGLISETRQEVWIYEEIDVKMRASSLILARILVGKVKDMSKLRAVFERTQVRPEVEGWNCVSWVKEALTAAFQDGKALGTNAGSWESVRDFAMQYVAEKKAKHRYDGQVQFNREQVATWDLLEGRELVE
ncbi:hypothetical protein F5Y17DRAFT_462871 [Xylariaceae sp. FL0594]|nr:hypothetical protein F5Y17DRAFT_462871 [Xylariaceae sp. FL0594]